MVELGGGCAISNYKGQDIFLVIWPIALLGKGLGGVCKNKRG